MCRTCACAAFIPSLPTPPSGSSSFIHSTSTHHKKTRRRYNSASPPTKIVCVSQPDSSSPNLLNNALSLLNSVLGFLSSTEKPTPQVDISIQPANDINASKAKSVQTPDESSILSSPSVSTTAQKISSTSVNTKTVPVANFSSSDTDGLDARLRARQSNNLKIVNAVDFIDDDYYMFSESARNDDDNVDAREDREDDVDVDVDSDTDANADAKEEEEDGDDGDDDDDDDDGFHTRVAARNGISQQSLPSSPSLKTEKRNRSAPSFPFFSRPNQTPNISSKLSYPNAMKSLPEKKLFLLMNTALDRQNQTNHFNQPLVTLLPYDLQRTIFDDLTATLKDKDNTKTPTSDNESDTTNKNQNTGDQSIWERSSQFVVDTLRFITFQQQDSSPPNSNRKSKYKPQTVSATYSTVAAMTSDDASSAAAAYAAAAAIASSSISSNVELNATEIAGLKAAIKAAGAISNSEDAAVFNNTIGVQSLVKAADLLDGPEKASALTALANIAIVLPRARRQMLMVNFNSKTPSSKNVKTIDSNSGILDIILDIVVNQSSNSLARHASTTTSASSTNKKGGQSDSDNGNSSSNNSSSLWYTEALVSSTHLLGSLALARNKEGRAFRSKMAKDTQVIKRLERISGGMKNGEAEGAARAARRALGSLGINRWKPRVPGQQGLRILSIDGGGTRAILAFETLKHLKKLTGCEIHELFDIIGGTSTGAIVAASIGIGHKTVEEVELLYRDMIGKVFARHPVNGPKMLLTRAYYDTNVLESTLQRECGRGVFIDSLTNENMNRVFVVSSVMSRDPKELFVFRNYTYPLGHESRYDGTTEAQLWEALRASSAAPTFFSEIRINGELHADGAIVANNPTAVALHETRCMFPGVPIELLVSLGNGLTRADAGSNSEGGSSSGNNNTNTGSSKITNKNDQNDKKKKDKGGSKDDAGNEKNKNMGWGDVVGSIVASATSTETVHHAMQDLFPDDKYFRFNPETDSTQIDETAPETLAMFVKEAQDYIAANHDDFDRVARMLRPKTPQSLWTRFKDALIKEIHELESTDWDDDLYLPK